MDTRYSPYQQQSQNGTQYPSSSVGGMPGRGGSGVGLPPGMQIPGLGLNRAQQQQQGASQFAGNPTSPIRSSVLGQQQQQQNFVPPSGDLLSMLNNKQQQATLSAADFPSLGGGTGVAGTPAPDFLSSMGKLAQSPTFGEEDFPALAGGGGIASSVGGGAVGAVGVVGAIGNIGTSGNIGNSGNSGVGQGNARVQVGVSQQQQQQQQQYRPANPSNGSGQAGNTSTGLKANSNNLAPADKHGLLGLLHVIRMIDPDLTTLALGTDLTTLGLNLNSQDPLWKTFVSPWAEGPAKQEIDPRIPDSFISPVVQMNREHWHHFKPDTLFYIFYGAPGEANQVRAAAELSRRGWMYHKDIKAWITRAPNTEPERKTDRTEVGSFLVFDVLNWEVVAKNLEVDLAAIEEVTSLVK